MGGDEEFLERFGPVFLDSYFVVDRNRCIKSFNEALVQMIGFRPAQKRMLVGSHCCEILRLEACQKNCIALKCLEKNAPVRMEEIRGKTADGLELVLELSAVPVRDEKGEVAAVFVTHRDVTDERRLKEQFLSDQTDSQQKVDALLKIVRDKDSEIERLRGDLKRRG